MGIGHGARHGTLMQMTVSSDGGMGSDATWPEVGALLMRLTTASSRIRQVYERDGFENVVTVQAIDALPVRILGYTTLRDLLQGNTPLTKRLRINYQGRTLTIIGVRMPNDGQVHGGHSVVNIDCIETPQPTGVMDKP